MIDELTDHSPHSSHPSFAKSANHSHMNIFFLDLYPETTGELHCDKHVVKMILESTQMLYMVHDIWGQRIEARVMVNGEERAPYKTKQAHSRHPCTLWAAGCKAHYNFLLKVAFALTKEYSNRYVNKDGSRKEHGCVAHLKSIASHTVPSHVPETIQPTQWLDWLRNTLKIKETSMAGIEKHVATVNTPPGTYFAVTCIDDEIFPQCKQMEGTKLDLVGTYRNYYAYKASNKFEMKWNKRKDVPLALENSFNCFKRAKMGCCNN